MKKYLPHALFLLLLGAYAWGSAIKVWSSGEILRAGDLNSNFAHLHNTKVGDGVLLVDADISGSAAITHSKLATPALLPKAMVLVSNGGGNCNSNPCTIVKQVNVTSVTWSGTGDYAVNFTAALASSNVISSVVNARGSAAFCVTVENLATQLFVKCYDAAGAPVDARFSLVVYSF